MWQSGNVVGSTTPDTEDYLSQTPYDSTADKASFKSNARQIQMYMYLKISNVGAKFEKGGGDRGVGK